MKTFIALSVLLFTQACLTFASAVGHSVPEQPDVPSTSAVDAYVKSLILSRAKLYENAVRSSGQLPGACEKCSKKKHCTNTNLICHKRRCVADKADRKKCKKGNGGGGGGSNGGEPGQCDKCSKKKGCSNANLFCHKKFCVSKKKQWRKCKKGNGGGGGGSSGGEPGQCDKCSKKKGCSNESLFCHKKFCVSKKKQWKKCKKGSGGGRSTPGQCEKCSKKKGCSNANLFCHKKFCVTKKKQWRKCKKANGGGENSGGNNGQNPLPDSEWCGPCAKGLLKCVAPYTCVLNHCLLLTPSAEEKPESSGLLQCAAGGHCTNCGDGKPPCARGFWCSKNRCVRMGFDRKSCKKDKSKLCEPCGLGRACIEKVCKRGGRKKRCRRVKCHSGFCVLKAKQVKKCRHKIRLSHRALFDTYESYQEEERVLGHGDDDDHQGDDDDHQGDDNGDESDFTDTIHDGEMSRFEDDDFDSEDPEDPEEDE